MKNSLTTLVTVVILISSTMLQAYFQQYRIDTSATDGEVDVGDSITLTWTVVADGTVVDSTGYAADGASLISSWIETMDDYEGVPVEERTTDLTNRLWFQAMAECFEIFSSKTGVNFEYVTYDSGTPVGVIQDGSPSGSFAEVGVKADVRIGGIELSGASAYSSTYNDGWASNIIMNTVASTFYNASTGDLYYSNIRGILMHEMGHSFGMDHYGVNGSGGTSIMGYNGNGPQFDDLRCLHRAHGDKNEQNGGNDTRATANDLGTLVEGTPLEIGGDMPAADAYTTILEAYTDIVSIDDDTDTDYYSFTLTDSVLVDVQVSPRGPMTYSYYYNYSTSSNSSGTAYPRESSDLSFVIYDANGSALTTVDAEEIGGTESARISLSAGTYYIAVTGDDSDANDAEEFTYTRTNWAGSGWTQFYGVSVSSFVEYAPVASDINTSTEQNTAIAVTLFGSDANGDDLTYQVVTAPSGGVLSGTAPNLTYTPNADYVGADSFTYVVNDGTADSEVATVNLMVLAPGALIPPVAHWPLDELSGETVVEDRTYNGYEGAATATTEVITGQIGNARSFNGTTSAIELPAGAFSTISDAISISLWVYGADNQPRSETVFSAMGSSGQRVAQMHLPWSNSNVYWDAGGSPGYDRINQLASAESYEGGWNHWVFTKDRLTGDMKIFLNGAVWHTGTGKTSSFVEVTSAFIGGVATESSSNYTGAIDDVILYDYALSESDVSRLYGNSPPTLSSDILTVNESGLSITLDSLDTDGDALIYILAAAPTSGSLSGVAPNLVYTPDETFSGSDSFSYYLNDGVVNSALATITIRETAVGYQAFLQQHTSIVETSFMADPDGDGVVNGLEYVLGGNPLNSDSRWGDLTGDGVNLTFSFDRLEESTSDTIQVFQYSYDLNIWNDVNLTGTIGSEASIGSAVDGMEPVTISLPGNVQTDQHLFWRLSVTEQ